jgi:hypothetical protein
LLKRLAHFELTYLNVPPKAGKFDGNTLLEAIYNGAGSQYHHNARGYPGNGNAYHQSRKVVALVDGQPLKQKSDQ